MLVKPVELANMLGYSESGVSLAVKRNKIKRREDGLIDLAVEGNYLWMCSALSRQGREIPQEISALFKGIRLITDNDNNKNQTPKALQSTGQNSADKASEEGMPAHGAQRVEGINPASEDESKTLSEIEQGAIAKGVTQSERDFKFWRARSAEETYETARIKNLELRGSLISINPLGRFLEAIIEGSRNAILNSITNIVTASLDIIKNGLTLDTEGKRIKEDSEIILDIVDKWTSEIEKIFTSTDKDLKSRIRQMKKDIKSRKEKE